MKGYDHLLQKIEFKPQQAENTGDHSLDHMLFGYLG
jgi:hypothetical protein